MEAYEIPLSAVSELFGITLSGSRYSFETRWCEPGGYWVLNITTDDGETPVANGIPLLPYEDLLSQLKHLGVPGQLIMQTLGDQGRAPTLVGLGAESLLFYVLP